MESHGVLKDHLSDPPSLFLPFIHSIAIHNPWKSSLGGNFSSASSHPTFFSPELIPSSGLFILLLRCRFNHDFFPSFFYPETYSLLLSPAGYSAPHNL